MTIIRIEKMQPGRCHFNHKLPRPGETFVTRKITMAVTWIAAGLPEELYLGSLDTCRDRDYAPEFTDAIWRVLQADEPGDYVVATDTSCSVADFVRMAFKHASLDWEKHVKFDPRFLRPNEVENLIGDASKAKKLLG